MVNSHVRCSRGKETDWARHNAFDVAGGESPGFKDIYGDGKPELLAHSSDLVNPPECTGRSGGQLGFAEIDWAQPLGNARFRPITPKSRENDLKFFRYTDGYGAGTPFWVGDLNKDGKADIVTSDKLGARVFLQK